MYGSRKIEESLFEKISQHFADGTPLSAVPPESRLIKSISDHVKRLLNTRKGTVPHMKDYGLTDVSEIYSKLPGSLEMLQKEMSDLIKKYEPRLEKIRVEVLPFEPYSFKIDFNIHGVIKGGKRVFLSTAFSSNGEITVESKKRLNA
ncbi:MAG: type VI secretion system baseplate subunit TssE [Colwellia sp.]